ncbi:MAG: GntR family transcriptional regulator [Candidatus Hadarchaeum sp.]|uniref:GntR family transcriptional regulator n=1 Tax=Candidatus Hadarchaeum sp. TaxID=2883567 RepID=UPI003181CCAA
MNGGKDRVAEGLAIDRGLQLPLYQQVALLIEELVTTDSRFTPGSRFLTEAELCDRFSVSRTTVRQAVELLVRRGILTKARGTGLRVGKPSEVHLLLMERLSLSESIEGGFPLQTRLLTLECELVSGPVASRLVLPLNDKVWHLKRQRFIKDEPLIVVDSYIPFNLFRDLNVHNFEKYGLYSIFTHFYKIHITHAERFARCARLFDHEIAALLGIHVLDPVLELEGLTFAGDKPVEYYKAVLKSTVVLHSHIKAKGQQSSGGVYEC